MNEKQKSHEALVCGHCGEKNRMLILAIAYDTEERGDESGPSYEVGDRYQIQLCPVCKKIVLVSGHWHDAMEDPEEWEPKAILPDLNDIVARRLNAQRKLDSEYMELAVNEAGRSTPDAKDKPKVGAVVVTRGGKKVIAGHRNEFNPGDHAEYTVLEKKCQNDELTGATVYTTLEPCTTRTFPYIPCANRLADRKVARVVIGMLDPDERIRGRGILALRKANIRVDLFPPDLMTKLEEMNRDFISSKDILHSHKQKPLSRLLNYFFGKAKSI